MISTGTGLDSVVRLMETWVKRIALGIVAIVAILFLWRVLLVIVVGLAALVAAVLLLERWREWWATYRFRRLWGRQGKDLLIVYSDSPHWQVYVEEHWLPKWGDRAVVLNWSQRKQWKKRQPEVALFHAVAGRTEFNPLGVVVPQRGQRARVVRFWLAFRDFKHGKDRLLRNAEAELVRYLGVPNQNPEPKPEP